MGKKTSTWLIVAVLLIALGSIAFGGVMSMLKWDFTKLSTLKYETSNYEITETYNDITIVTKTADVVFKPSDNLETRVLCNEQKNLKHSVSLRDGVLLIEVNDTRKWYEHIGINIGTPKITVYIPQGEYGKLSVKTDTGNVEIPKDFKFLSVDVLGSTGHIANYASVSESIKINTSTGNIRCEKMSAQTLTITVSTGYVSVSDAVCDDIKINVSTGKVNLTNIKCNNLISEGSTGDMVLNDTIATGKLSIERDTGDVTLEGCDAGEIIIKTSTGDVKGNLLTNKVFIAYTDTGKVAVPETTSGGKCEIKTDTGDIKITIKQ